VTNFCFVTGNEPLAMVSVATDPDSAAGWGGVWVINLNVVPIIHKLFKMISHYREGVVAFCILSTILQVYPVNPHDVSC